MNFTSRLKFIFGILIVVAIVGALTLYLNATMSRAESSKAELAADTTSIGTDYPGLVVTQNVEEGDRVRKDQVLFEIQSPQLKQATSTGGVSEESLPFPLNPTTKNIQLKASDDGVIENIAYKAGSYAPAGGIVATVNTVGSLHVVANFRLSPPDYARISKDSKVDLRLPDNTTLKATIFAITLERNDDNVDTVVKARIKDADINDFRFSIGTPVEATLSLQQETWYDNLVSSVQQLFMPTGR